VLILTVMGCAGSARLTEQTDVCGGQTCSLHGHCMLSDGAAACRCDPGYVAAGLSCEPVPSSVGADPCRGVTCGGHGTCASDGGAAACRCAPGYHANAADCVADAPVFVRGYNFGDTTAADVTLSGNTLQAQGVSGSSSLRLTAGGAGTLDAWATNFLASELMPATDAETAALLNHHFSVVPAGSLTIQQGLTNGSYLVFTYQMENVPNHVRHIQLRVQGELVTAQPLALTALQWRKLGPYSAQVTNGVLTVELISDADTSIMGLEIYSTTGGQVHDLPAPGCGNGVIEPGEDCDSEPCCDATCHLRTAGFTCRAAVGECDAAELCSGGSAICPPDAAQPDGAACTGGACTGGTCQGSGVVGPGSAVLSRLNSPTLAFHDEFDALDAGTDSLAAHTWWEGVPRAAVGAAPSRAFSISNSILTLTTDDQDGSWTQPMLSSADGTGAGFFMGPNSFLEVRALMSGWAFIRSLPRAWSMGTVAVPGQPSTYDAEHDWLDNDTTCFNNAFLTTLHLNDGGGGGVADQTRQFNGDSPHTTDAWHTYGFWRTADRTEIYVDDVLMGSLDEAPGGDQPLMLVLGVAPGGVGGCGAGGSHAFSLQVDFVRVWQ
jgi:hypothetical protein